MIETAPAPVDTLDFQFKLHCRLKVFQEKDTGSFATSCNLLAVASRYGLLFVGSNNRHFQVIQLQNIQNYNSKDGDIDNYIRRTIALPSSPQHLSISCDCSKLGVIVKEDDCPKAIIYDVTSFVQQNISIIKEIRLSPTPNVNVLEAVWNPAVPTLFTVCKNDGSLAVYDIKEGGIEINELQKSAGVMCMCWSPKGKQISVGSRDGKITQYKPDLKITRVIDVPPLKEKHFPIALQWISNYQFIAIYRTNDANGQSNLIVVNCPKGSGVTYVNYEDVCYSYGNNRPHQFYMLLQNIWNILLVASANSMEVGVLGFEKEIWTQWILADSARAELPLSATKQDTLPIGLCLDTSRSQPLPWGEGTVPPPPLLLILSHHGVLCCFHAVNLKDGAASICQAPEALANCAAGAYTTSSDQVETLPNKPIPINPSKTSIYGTPTFSFTPNQGPKLIATSSNNAQPLTAQSFLSGSPILKSDNTSASTQPTSTFTAKSIQNVQLHAKPFQTKNQVSKQPTDPRLTNEISVNAVKVIEKPEEQTDIAANEMELLIAQMVREECAALESEFKAFVKQKRGVKIDLGTDSEATDLVQSTNKLQEFVDEISEICQAQSTEIHLLKQNLIQNWAWYEEARSRFASDKDPVVLALARAQPLDAASARQLEEIRHLLYYLQSQLTQANTALDDQWESFQDSCKKRMSLKLPSIEAIYQSMVKQSATVQKQIYILKDISNRIKSTAHMRTIPHLLVSLDNVDVLEEQLKHLQMHSKDLLQMRYKGVFEKQRQLTPIKSQKLSQLLKTRRFNRVCVSKPRLPNTSMHLNGLSPILHKKEFQPQRLNFVQSTPKIPDEQKKNNIELKKAQPVLNLFENNDDKGGNEVLTMPHVQTAISNTNTKSSNIFTEIPNSNTFGFTDMKTLPISAFASTTKTTTIGVKNSTDNNPSNIPVNKSGNIFSFSVPTSIITSATSTAAHSAPISVVFTTSSDIDSNQKFLFSSKSNNVTVSTTKFAFATPLSSVHTSAPNTLQKNTFCFSNLASTSDEKPASPSAGINKTPFNMPFDGNFTFLPNFSSSISSDVATTTKDILIISTAATVSPSIAPSISVAKPFEFLQTSKPSVSTFLSLTSITPITTNCATIIDTTADTSKMPTTPTPVKTSSNAFIKTESVNFTMPTTVTFFSTPTKNEPSVTITPISTTLPQLFPTSTVSNQSLDLTTDNKDHSASNVSTATTATVTTVSSQSSLIGTPAIKSEMVSPTTAASNTTANIFLSPTSSFSFRGVNTSTAALQPNIFQTPSQSTVETAKLPLTTSVFGSSQENTSIFGSPQKTVAPATSNSVFSSDVASSSVFSILQTPVFGTPSTTATVATTTSAPVLQPFLSVNSGVTTTVSSFFNPTNVGVSTTPSTRFEPTKVSATTVPSLFNPTNVGISTTPSTIFESTKVSSSTPQTSIFCAGTTANPMIQASAFGPPTTLFGSQNASITIGNIFGATSTGLVFPTAKSTFAGAFSSTAPTSSSANTSPIFFTPSSSAPTVFGQSATFGSTSIFNNPISANVGSIFGGVSNTQTSGFDTATTATSDTQFGPMFGTSSSNSTNVFGSPIDSFRFSSNPGTNTSTGTGSFAFNQPGFTTFGNTSSSTDTASLSFGSIGLSTTSSNLGSGFTQNPFGRVPAQEQKTAFSGGSLFGTPVTTSTSNIFGGSSPFNKSTPAFGGPATFGSPPVFGQQQGSGFGQNAFSSNTASAFGNSPPGPFSRNTQTINQTGFGASPLFNSQSAFGSTTPGGFGAPPTFGSAAFGNTPTFNEASKSFPDTFASSNQQSSNFANLANQPTLGFGNLAQQNQTTTSQPAFSPGSSFSNWR